MSPLIDLTGQRFGRWTVIEPIGTKPVRWRSLCDCGTTKIIRGEPLRDGESKSCGCVGAERFRRLDMRGDNNPARHRAQARHGLDWMSSRDPWYRRAASIRARCKQDFVEFGFISLSECGTYLKSIAPTHCPVFGTKLRGGAGAFAPDAPSIDRIRCDLGYVRGNLQVISFKANAMKANATQIELRQFARWILKK